MNRLIIFAVALTLAACGGKPKTDTLEQTSNAADPGAPDEQPDTQPDASREEVFKAALIEFGDKGETALFEALLSKRMLGRVKDSQAKVDADPAKQAELKSMATKLGIPETTNEMDVRAAVWRAGLKEQLEELRGATVTVQEDGDRLRVKFVGTDATAITVADEDGVLKIDEN